MSIDLLKNWNPYKYLTNNERKELTLQQFNDDFEKAKEQTRKDIEQLENEELKKLNDDEEIRYKKSQVSSLLEFENIRDKWSEYMFNFIKKTVSCNFDYSNVEIVYFFLTIIFMIVIYFILFLFYSFIKNNDKNKNNNDININLHIN